MMGASLGHPGSRQGRRECPLSKRPSGGGVCPRASIGLSSHNGRRLTCSSVSGKKGEGESYGAGKEGGGLKRLAGVTRRSAVQLEDRSSELNNPSVLKNTPPHSASARHLLPVLAAVTLLGC